MRLLATFVLLLQFCLPATCIGQDEKGLPDGKASYYAKKFQGRRTASGEAFDNTDYTAAHRTLPFNTYLNIINKSNNYNIIVRVNDRGPYAKNRVVDLSEAAARRIGGYQKGLVHVKVEILDLIQFTPELEAKYTDSLIMDCLGNPGVLTGISLSLWSTNDLVHALYIANDLYLKENVSRVFIGTKQSGKTKRYHVIVSGIDDKKQAEKLKDMYEQKGFMRVTYFKP